MSMGTLWLLLIFGYLLTILIELPVLICGLSSKYSSLETIVNGFLLTALTYPVVVMVLPAIFTGMAEWGSTVEQRTLPLQRRSPLLPKCCSFDISTAQSLIARPDRDAAVIVTANRASFLLGEAGLSRWLAETVQGIVQ